MTALQQKHQLGIIDGLGQEHIRVSAKWLDRLADTGISVYRKNNCSIISVGNARHRAANAGNPSVEAFAAVTRHQNHSPAREMRRQNGRAPRTQVWPVIQ
jgi:hypothetical protein